MAEATSPSGPKRRSSDALGWIAAAIAVALLSSAGTLLLMMHRDFDHVRHVQLPIVERAGANLRLAGQLEIRSETIVRDPAPAALDEYKRLIESLGAQAESLRQALENEPRLKPLAARAPTNRMINNASGLHNLLRDGQRADAQKLYRSPTFGDETAKFVAASRDVTDGLGRLRDEMAGAHLRGMRIVAVEAALLLIVLALQWIRRSCYKI